MKMFERLQAKKKDNKGFSLVELIIVIAIMAILVGVVGTQVVPYLNKSKYAKDQQILSAFATAAVSAYSMKAGECNGTGTATIFYFGTGGTTTTGDGVTIRTAMADLVGYTADNAGKDKVAGVMSSAPGKALLTATDADGDIMITMNFSQHTVKVELVNVDNADKVEPATATL